MNVSTRQQQIAELAKREPKISFTSINKHLDVTWLEEAYRRMRKDSAPGVDGQTVREYGENLKDNLEDLLNRAKSGSYFAPPVRRVHIPKGRGKETRPLGVPTTEDKLLQRAVAMLLEPIYEQEFLDCSYGFRPRRSAHDALEFLWDQSMRMPIRWILDVDISKFYDTIDHGFLREFLQHRVRDGVIRKLIDKWLKAGVLEKGQVSYPTEGTPQGGSISPLLSNIYLHHVLDVWFDEEVKHRCRGKVFVVRYADDAVLGFTREEDAKEVLGMLKRRCEHYGLTLHPGKTRIVAFQRPRGNVAPKPGTFDFLGFTHYWGKSRRGIWVVKRKTDASRFNRALKRVAQWCRQNRHKPLVVQQRDLSRKLKGHFAYYGITGNYRYLRKFRRQVLKLWRKWLSRRTRRVHMPVVKFESLQRVYPLPPARAVHSICAAKP